MDCPWDFPGKNTGKWKWKLLSCVWLFATPWTIQSMEFSRPEYWSEYHFPSPGDLPNPGLLHCRQILYQLSHKGSPRILECVAYPFSRGFSWPRSWTGVSCIAGGFFTSWATREARKTPYDPAISLLGIYLEKTIIRKDTCTPIFIAALFTMPGHGSNLNVHQQRNG